MGKRPGYLKQYATHAGISRQAAADQLERVGIDYLAPFDFSEADKRREAARHADRAAFAAPIYNPNDDEPVDEETKKHPKFIESQARREWFKASLTELEYLEQVGKLIPAGTGLDRYRNIRVEPTAEARAAAYDLSYDPYDYDIAGSNPSVPLDEFDLDDLR